MNRINFTRLLPLIILPFITGCHDYSGDISDGYVKEKADKIEYAAAFEKAFGKIAPNQTWDMTGDYSHTYLPDIYGMTATRATLEDETEPYFEIGDWFEMGNLYDAVNDFRFEVDNQPKGVPCAMYTPDRPFSLVPVYQGNCRNNWELHFTVGTGADAKSYLLYTKAEGKQDEYIQNKRTANSDYEPVYTTVNWEGFGKPSTEDPTDQVAQNHPNWQRVYNIRSKEIIFDFPAGTPIFFWLKVQKHIGNSNQTYWREESSLNGDMLDVTNYVIEELGSERPNCIEDNEVFKIYGMEANLSGNVGESSSGSRDFCDCMFMIKGEEIPEIFEVKETETEIKKRYLIEDLAQFDFDFNDVVLDLKQVHKTRFTITYDSQGNEQIVAFDLDETRQYASIAHQCGTLPLKLFIGDYQMPGPEEGEEYIYPGKGGGPKGSSGWNPTEDELGENFAAHYNNIQLPETNPWMPGENNIIVKVKQAGSETTNGSTIYYNSITYPKDGEAPMIIAVPAGTDWMPEMIQITPQYFPEPALEETNP